MLSTITSQMPLRSSAHRCLDALPAPLPACFAQALCRDTMYGVDVTFLCDWELKLSFALFEEGFSWMAAPALPCSVLGSWTALVTGLLPSHALMRMELLAGSWLQAAGIPQVCLQADAWVEHAR